MESVGKKVVPEHLSHFVEDHINLVGRLAILGLFIAWPQLDLMCKGELFLKLLTFRCLSNVRNKDIGSF